MAFLHKFPYRGFYQQLNLEKKVISLSRCLVWELIAQNPETFGGVRSLRQCNCL